LARDSGQGLWFQAFEELKRKLAAAGYFEQSRKRPLPFNPQRVALITAPTGAAIRDFLRIAEDRGLGSHIRLHPVAVQGEEAPPGIVAALEEANRQNWAEVIVLIRGGGSIQDLWAFNDERVAAAIFASGLPVLTGVGHEIDHSIADFVADRACATPSHAAQLLWPERRVLIQLVDDAETVLCQVMERLLRDKSAGLNHMGRTLALLNPERHLARQKDGLAASLRRMRAVLTARLDRHDLHLDSLHTRLHNAGHRRLTEARRSLEQSCAALPLAGQRLLVEQEHGLERLALRLAAQNPHAPLDRGYALVRLRGGLLARSVSDAPAGTRLAVELRDGILEAEVLSTVNRHQGEHP